GVRGGGLNQMVVSIFQRFLHGNMGLIGLMGLMGLISFINPISLISLISPISLIMPASRLSYRRVPSRAQQHPIAFWRAMRVEFLFPDLFHLQSFGLRHAVAPSPGRDNQEALAAAGLDEQRDFISRCHGHQFRMVVAQRQSGGVKIYAVIVIDKEDQTL